MLQNTRYVPQSLFDRCLDDEPKKRQEAVLTEAESVALYEKSVRRDLELLLNTRKSKISGIERFAFVNKSILNFGVAEMSDFDPRTTEGQEHIKTLIKSAIELFEPRLSGVEVAVIDAGGDGKLNIKILALLEIALTLTPISYDATLDTKTQLYSLGG